VLVVNDNSVTSLPYLFQGESHYDEEKEIIQKQLKIERDELLLICQQHQVHQPLTGCVDSGPVAPLASSEAVGHGCCTDSQGAGHSHSSVSQRPDTEPHTNLGSAFIRRSAAGHSQDTV